MVKEVEVASSSIPVDVKLVILSPAVIAMSVPPVVLPLANTSDSSLLSPTCEST